MRQLMVVCAVALVGGCAAWKADMARRDEEEAVRAVRRSKEEVVEARDRERIEYQKRQRIAACGTLEVYPAGVQPQRPFRVIGPVDAKFDITSDGAFRTLQKKACAMNADGVVGMTAVGHVTSGPAYGQVVMNPGGSSIQTGQATLYTNVSSYTTYHAVAIVYTDHQASGAPVPAREVYIDLRGPDATTSKMERCRAAVEATGATWTPHSPVWAVLTLAPSANSFQLMSASGVVVDEVRPGWTVPHLCENAAAAILDHTARTAAR
jgi:hypothetical protein